MESINIEEIMEQIRADIRKKGIAEDEPDFESVVFIKDSGDTIYSEDVYKEAINRVNVSTYVESYRELFGGALEQFVKKVIRKMTAFYVEAIVDSQNVYNRNVYDVLAITKNKFKADDKKMEVLEKKLYECEKKIAELEKQLADKNQ